jgi:selenocysteine lyase/cysteine desulfurase
LLIVPGVGGATGDVLPLSKFAAIAHRHRARLLVDASDLAARRVINMTSHGIDYVVLAGRQLAGYGPATIVGRPDWMTRVAGIEPDPAVLRGLAQSCVAVTDLGFEWIGLHEESLSEVLDAALQRLPGTRRLQLWPDVSDRVGIASVAIAGRDDPIGLRWGFGTGQNELARQLNSLADVVLEQERS